MNYVNPVKSLSGKQNSKTFSPTFVLHACKATKCLFLTFSLSSPLRLGRYFLVLVIYTAKSTAHARHFSSTKSCVYIESKTMSNPSNSADATRNHPAKVIVLKNMVSWLLTSTLAYTRRRDYDIQLFFFPLIYFINFSCKFTFATLFFSCWHAITMLIDKLFTSTASSNHSNSIHRRISSRQQQVRSMHRPHRFSISSHNSCSAPLHQLSSSN